VQLVEYKVIQISTNIFRKSCAIYLLSIKKKCGTIPLSNLKGDDTMSWENEQGTQYRNEYQRQHYDRFSLMLPKGKKNEYMALAEKNGMKLNAFINKLLENSLLEDKMLEDNL